jgi:uncharacterized protein YndB with AHSA1/START domain
VADPVIEITRVFDAPRERVWQEWTEPERFADWFGGPASDVPLDSVAMDVQPGGAWRLTMLADSGRRRIDWHGEYLEVDEPSRLVLSMSDEPSRLVLSMSDEPASDRYAIVTVVLSELGDGRTEMQFRQSGPLPPEAFEAATRGWGVFFDRIDERLRT